MGPDSFIEFNRQLQDNNSINNDPNRDLLGIDPFKRIPGSKYSPVSPFDPNIGIPQHKTFQGDVFHLDSNTRNKVRIGSFPNDIIGNDIKNIKGMSSNDNNVDNYKQSS